MTLHWKSSTLVTLCLAIIVLIGMVQAQEEESAPEVSSGHDKGLHSSKGGRKEGRTCIRLPCHSHG